jgi:hypothetical protein
MDSKAANQLARILGGRADNTGGGIYLVTIDRPGGSLVVFSGDCVCEYESEEAFEAGRPSSTIVLARGASA